MVAWAIEPFRVIRCRLGEDKLPATLQGVALHVYEASVPTPSLLLCCPVTLWGKWGVYVLEMQKPRVKVDNRPMAISCYVVNRVCPQLLQGTFMVPASVKPLP